MADIFGKEQTIKAPITADKCTITWDGKTVTQAMQFSLSYGQQVTKRRSIGGKDAIVYGSFPQGQVQIARLLTTDISGLMSGNSWTCGSQGKITFETASCASGADGVSSSSSNGLKYTCNGCIVTSFSVSANADDLTVVDNITLEFLELTI